MPEGLAGDLKASCVKNRQHQCPIVSYLGFEVIFFGSINEFSDRLTGYLGELLQVIVNL